jgi:4'-phosphopantetheinyl transferase
MSRDLQIFQVRLDISQIECDRLWQFLSEDERSRANNFKREHLKQRFVAARGNLRQILSEYLCCEPSEILFSYGDRGKPYVEGVYFNLAHSRDLAIYAMSRDREVGIDLEYVDPKCDIKAIAKRYFGSSEREIIERLSDRNQDLANLAFYRAWTLKEAYGKATGQGIANILDFIDVGELLELPIGEVLQIDNWALKALDTQPSYAAALCLAIS